MKYEGYTLTKIEEQTLSHEMKPAKVSSYDVLAGDKLVASGLPNQEAAKGAVNRRIAVRKRMGLEPLG